MITEYPFCRTREAERCGNNVEIVWKYFYPTLLEFRTQIQNPTHVHQGAHSVGATQKGRLEGLEAVSNRCDAAAERPEQPYDNG